MRKKIEFKKLIDEYPRDYPVDVKFEVFRWMILTGWEQRHEGRWGASGVFEWLYHLSGTNAQSYWYDKGFRDERWDERLTMALIRGVAMTPPRSVSDWRGAERIALDRYRMLDLRVGEIGESGQIKKNLDWIFSEEVRKKRLHVQLNESHDGAREINSVLFTTNGTEWIAKLDYGYDGSSWTHQLARQGESSFGDFVNLARGELCCLVDV